MLVFERVKSNDIRLMYRVMARFRSAAGTRPRASVNAGASAAVARLLLVDVAAEIADQRRTWPIGTARRVNITGVHRPLLPLYVAAAIGQVQALALLCLTGLALLGIIGPQRRGLGGLSRPRLGQPRGIGRQDQRRTLGELGLVLAGLDGGRAHAEHIEDLAVEFDPVGTAIEHECRDRGGQGEPPAAAFAAAAFCACIPARRRHTLFHAARPTPERRGKTLLLPAVISPL